MGAEEDVTPVKPSKSAAPTQDIPATPSYPDWSTSMQAYYGAGAPAPFFASTVASPTPHPYMWGGQHPLIPPYGTPVPYPAMYPPGGVYAHPGMPTAPSIAQTNADVDGKNADGKDRGSAKKPKGNTGGKAGDSTKATSGSANDISQSGDSGTEGTSDGSDENHQEQAAANARNNSAGAVQSIVPGKPVVSMPATTLNIGMDIWSATPAAGAAKIRTNASGAGSAVAPGMPEQWIQQDERELKRQKRKQSNRESARRSRLRKQAECEELQTRVENLTNDNRNLRDELQRLSEECEKLASENNSTKEELTRVCGPAAVANLEQNNPSSVQSRGGEANS